MPSASEQAAIAEIARLDAQKSELERELKGLAQEADRQLAENRDHGGGGTTADTLAALSKLTEASARRLRSREILSELLRIQRRINELSGAPTETTLVP